MKFWQYAVGIALAILIFAAAVVADMMQYNERSTFSQNPFSLLGAQKSTFGGQLEFLESGEMIWLDDGSDLEVTKTERRLNSGTAVIGGTFFETTKDTAHTNQLWFGDMRMYARFATALVNVDDEGITKVLTGGGSVELYFGDEESPFVIPAHSQVEIPYLYELKNDPDYEYFVIREDLNLRVLEDTELAQKLTSAEMALAGWRTQFGHFAWNIPRLWAIPVGPVVQFLEKITIPLPALKQARRDFQEEMQPLIDAHELSKERAVITKLETFRQRNLDTSLLQRLLIQLSQESKEWAWFEFSQKFWLPVVAPDTKENKFSILWRSEGDEERELIRSVMLLSHNGKVLRSDEQLAELAEQLEDVESHPADIRDLSRLRRELTAVLNAFSIHRSKENFELYSELASLELALLEQTPKEKEYIAIEIGHDVLRFVRPLINFSEEREKVIILNDLWSKLPLVTDVEIVFSEEQVALIEDIELVGVSGITPAKMRLKIQQQEEQEAVSEQLGDIKESGEDEILSGVDAITNAKKLWEFLANEKIQIDITQFRTTRTEEEVTTRFANTEVGTKKIAGVFDYKFKSFKSLTLGEESTTDLPAHQLGLWMKLIGGKFDSGDAEVVEKVVDDSAISQTAPQAILARKLTQEVLKGLGVEAAREDVEVVSGDFQITRALNVIYENARLTTEYNLVTRSFSHSRLSRSGREVVNDASVSADDMGGELERLMMELQQN